MTSQMTNKREAGFTSCHGYIQKLRAFTYKELETVRATQKLLGGKGSAQAEGGRSQRSQIHSKPPGMYENSEKNGQSVPSVICKGDRACTQWLSSLAPPHPQSPIF
jgi:hypothetical protein